MVRKRDAWTRHHDRLRIRPKTPAPQTGWLISELATLSAQPRRTIGYYVQQGLLAKPAFRGTATRYGRAHLLRLLCIEHFQKEGNATLKQIKQRLDAMNDAELTTTVASLRPSAAVATALGLAAPSAPGAPALGQGVVGNGTPHGVASSAAPTASLAPHESAELPGEAWRRVQLLPGLELLLAADASPAVRQVAGQIRAYCARG